MKTGDPTIDVSGVCSLLCLAVMLADQHCEDRSEQHEDQRLYEPHQHFHELKRNGNQPAETRDEKGHRFQQVFARIDVPVEAKT